MEQMLWTTRDSRSISECGHRIVTVRPKKAEVRCSEGEWLVKRPQAERRVSGDFSQIAGFDEARRGATR